MATSISHAQRREDFKEEFLTCSICAESYDNDTHQAKCLPCLHTYCKTCLQTLAGQRPKFNCPNCRYVVALPGGTVDNLPNNFLVENLKEYRDIFSVSMFCGSCDEVDNQAVNFCHDCGCFLCQTCVDAHRRMAPLRSHKLSTIQELQEKKRKFSNRQQATTKCRKHDQDLLYFCTSTMCRFAVCAVCRDDHHGHYIIDLSAAVNEMASDIQQLSARISDRNQELVEKRVSFEALQKKRKENFDKMETEIEESKQTLLILIESQFNQAHSSLKRLYQAETNRLTKSIESADFLSAKMISACEFANEACKQIGETSTSTNIPDSHQTQLLDSQRQIMTRLQELENTELPASFSDKTNFTLTDAHHTAMARIQDSLQHFCDIELRLPSPQIDPSAALLKSDYQEKIFQTRQSFKR
ncbi:E3 ubiquitin-protein ligase TRIM56-like [Amphiura filiformis]|uniref:E3 ubiquitin-protein ligase TRIM56-like n=1 Tax=Amphiura filiformis TaxID=82378 RepID=UPI003B21178B